MALGGWVAASGHPRRPSTFAKVVVWGVRAIIQPTGGLQRAVVSVCMHLCNQCRGVRKVSMQMYVRSN